MRRFLLLLLLVFTTAIYADVSIKVALNFDNTVDTNFRAGEKAQGGGGCSTWTCVAKGDVTEVTASSLTISAAGTNDEPPNVSIPGGIVYAYKSEATDTDLQIVARIPLSWVGHTESFTQFGVGLTEGTATGDYIAQVGWPFAGTARFKTDAGAAGEVTQNGAVGQFLPRYLAITYDDATNLLCAYESDDAVTWSIIGTCISKTLTFPVLTYVYDTSHDPALSTTATLTDVVFSTTITVTDDAPVPPPPPGNSVNVPNVTTYDCNVNGIQPGTTLVMTGLTRGRTQWKNCFGTVAQPIRITNDTSLSGPVVISYSGSGFGNSCTNCENVVFDGTGKWAGAGADGNVCV